MNKLLRIVVVTLAILSVVTSALAQDAVGQVTDDDVNAIAKKMYCPVCENIPLDTCPTAACIQWRAEIRQQLQQGKTEAEILSDFVLRFGDRVVGVPQDPALSALSLVTPWIITLVALVSGVAIFLNWRSHRVNLTVAADQLSQPLQSDDAYRARLEADLKLRR